MGQIGAFHRENKCSAALHSGGSHRSNGGRTKLSARRCGKEAKEELQIADCRLQI